MGTNYYAVIESQETYKAVRELDQPIINVLRPTSPMEQDHGSTLG
jgi:hypothetical protein